MSSFEGSIPSRFVEKVVSFPTNSVAIDKETAIFNTNTIDGQINEKCSFKIQG
jgi:hypothetical protein